MKSILLYLLFFLGLATLIYYIYLMIIGKRLASLMESKDRYIWNGLKNTKDKVFSGKSTVFLDNSRLIVAKDSLPRVYSKLRSGGLTDAIVIPFDQIVAFDYDRQGKLLFLRRLFNRIFRVNDFLLKVDYLLPGQGVQRLRFRAASMDPLDFEAAFADFNNKIYGDKVLLRSGSDEEAHYSYLPETAQKEVLDYEEEKTTAIPVAAFNDSPMKEEVPTPLQEDELEKTTVLPSIEEIQEEPSRKEEIKEVEELEKTTILPLASLEEKLPEKEEVDLEKTTAITQEEFKVKAEEITPAKEYFEEEKVKPVFEEDTVEIKRRSFLDRRPIERTSKPDTKVKDAPAEDKTIAVELPDELKRKDTSGLTEEEIRAQEMERLRKLKQFFSQENSENN